jgi:polyhydroxybutyrate depolymerase
VGGKDSVLKIHTYSFPNPTYEITSLLASSPAVLDPILIGEWYEQANVRAPLMCSDTTLNPVNPSSSDSATNTWSSCSSRLELIEVLNADHGIESLQQYSGYQMIDLIISFIDQLSSS